MTFPGPVLAAPMAGGAGTPALLAACGGGFLAGGYLAPDALAARIAEARAGGTWFGVNVFAPSPTPVAAGALRRYLEELRAEFAVYDLTPALPSAPDDDHWAAKLDLLLADPVPAVSFTFGLPPAATVAALRRAGTLVLQTVTTAEEAVAAAAAGVDALVVQASVAGGHSATLTPEDLPAPVPLPLPGLVAAVRAAVPLPVVAAGGLATSADVAAALHAGAAATMVGTALLRTDEAGTSATHRAALTAAAVSAAAVSAAGHDTVVTRVFTGRPARALRNGFIDRHDATAPLGYPQVHHLTAPLRRAAATAGDADRVHLWAGTGHRHAATGRAAAVMTTLTAAL
ncbi:nitronate monooxygenase [Dactylosporangium siamense]|uniref:Propionate 3-nitronate monooxygenase n=1 Tax=Dactylosporangium siamense TaxID=685454 RepID=A0A919PGH5_9ACTN|nr:nitronate monooxygenase [Dactylosporangium siamense]GIG42816.1 oxidoreductase [Dactylosporangium siamense]